MSPVDVVQKVIQEVRSGLVSSVVAEAILFPLDTVKLRQQVYGGTVLDVLQSILKEHGLRGVYQGLLGRLLQTITSNVGFFFWQTLFVHFALRSHSSVGNGDVPKQLSTGLSLLVNMFAQQFNRILTTPMDVVANVNQADPTSKGFFHTFVKLARTGGRSTLWRGLGVSLLLSLNPALMFTLVGKFQALILRLRGKDLLGASDMFWISGLSKAVATLVTYPLIRAKAVIQTTDQSFGLFAMLVNIVQTEGAGGLFRGVWIMSYKTVLFNSLMMALKQKVTQILELRSRKKPPLGNWSSWVQEGKWRQKVSKAHGKEFPWTAAENGHCVVYVDGSWSFLHPAQVYFLKEAARRGDHLVVGIHSDECHQTSVGTWPPECYAQRIERLRGQGVVHTILEHAPWEVSEDLLHQLGISKVLGGSVTKTEDCTPPSLQDGKPVSPTSPSDPYLDCKKLGIFQEVPSLNKDTEHDEWIRKITRVAFSNVDASIDWRILVTEGAKTPWGENPGYAETPKTSEPKSRSKSEPAPQTAHR